ncbi:MAG: T9SS type A sorting domain-containing protein [Bacteroidales bacterium]|nr:T9SS type A sorting domain-containing protein [Bacteroidales bacterium]MCF8327553.1 T9SS type A sorting domain-containing protein [Bacteroidales bacterium]
MKKQLLLIAASVLLHFSDLHDANAQTPAAYDYLNTNNVKARISADGNHFWDFQGIPEYEIPKGSNKHTIFSNTLWIGGHDSNGQLYLSGQRYKSNGEDHTFGPLSTDGNLSTDPQTINDYNSVWRISRSQIDQHIAWANDPSSMPGYTIPTNILNWPAHGDTTKNQSYNLAPFKDVNGNGKYDPQNGDYPSIRGDQAIFFIFNDAGTPNTETGGTPLGIEVHGMAYAFDCSKSDAFHHTTFMHYKIINRSNRDYYNTYLGLFTDFDIGDAYGDYIGCDVQRGSMYAYNGKPFDGDSANPSHYGNHPPAQSMTILGGPFKDADGTDNPAGQCDESINGMNFGNNIVDDERLGMTGFTYFSNVGVGQSYAMTDPEQAHEYYLYLQGKWKDSTSMLYGGNAHNSTNAYGPECKFMFPGDTDTCNWGTGGVQPNGPEYWTEITAGNEPYDRRGVAKSGPFTFEAGETHELDYAFVYGRDTAAADSIGHLASIEKMQENIDSVRNAFFNNESPCGGPIIASARKPIVNHSVNIDIYPNPAINKLNIHTNQADNYQCFIYDVFGRLILTKHINSSAAFDINIQSLPKGVYILRLSSGNTETTQKFIKQ